MTDIDQLTCFADYRIPQVFHYKKIFKYDESLDQKIHNEEILVAGSQEESEIWGNMIYLVIVLREKLQ